jgi:transposase, IS30 family
MTVYGHLTYEERERLAVLCAEGLCPSEIAQELGRNRSSVYRELSRNSNADGSYRAASADRRYMARRQRMRFLDANSELAEFVVERLQEGWTPQQISGWLDAGNENLPSISFEAIYDWLYGSTQKAEKRWKLLPTKRARRGRRKRRKARNTIAGRRSIHDRPEEVERRETAGHWEGDLMICKRSRPVLVLKERKSRFVIAAKLSGKTAAETASAIMDIFRRLAPDIRKSITFDNGGEFARHGLIRDAFKISTWFCDAYASWQKGAVENMNGRLRRDLPRNLDIDKLGDEELQDILLTHNLTPRKCLGYKTPVQAILKELGIDAKLSFRSNVALRV